MIRSTSSTQKIQIKSKAPAHGWGLSYGNSSVGRASVSKTEGRGFESSFKGMLKKIINYCKACYDELAHKTTWPTRKELTHSAVVVLSASLIIALVVWAMDFVFKSFMSLVYPA